MPYWGDEELEVYVEEGATPTYVRSTRRAFIGVNEPEGMNDGDLWIDPSEDEDFINPAASDVTFSDSGLAVITGITDVQTALAAVDAALVDFGTFFRKVRQVLTEKTSFTGTSNEQWGTEEATLDDALLPKLTAVTVEARGYGRATNPTSGSTLQVRVEISLDGGATWSNGTNCHWLAAAGNAADTELIACAHSVTGTVTGDIQARMTASCSSGASTSFDLTNGVIYLDVVVSP